MGHETQVPSVPFSLRAALAASHWSAHALALLMVLWVALLGVHVDVSRDGDAAVIRALFASNREAALVALGVAAAVFLWCWNGWCAQEVLSRARHLKDAERAQHPGRWRLLRLQAGTRTWQVRTESIDATSDRGIAEVRAQSASSFPVGRAIVVGTLPATLTVAAYGAAYFALATGWWTATLGALVVATAWLYSAFWTVLAHDLRWSVGWMLKARADGQQAGRGKTVVAAPLGRCDSRRCGGRALVRCRCGSVVCPACILGANRASCCPAMSFPEAPRPDDRLREGDWSAYGDVHEDGEEAGSTIKQVADATGGGGAASAPAGGVVQTPERGG